MISKSFTTHPTRFATAIGASFAASFETDAAIIYSGIQNITVTVTNSSTIQSANLDIDDDGGNDLRFFASFFTSSTSDPTSRFSVIGSLNLGNFGGISNRPLNSSGLLIPFLAGDPIGPADFMAPTIGNNGAAVRGLAGFSGGTPLSSVQGLIPPGEQASFIPIEFQAAGNTHYGWVRLRLNDYINEPGNSFLSGTIIDWAYEDTPDTSITAGAVPEPSSLALLALGATGMGAVRRRRKKS